MATSVISSSHVAPAVGTHTAGSDGGLSDAQQPLSAVTQRVLMNASADTPSSGLAPVITEPRQVCVCFCVSSELYAALATSRSTAAASLSDTAAAPAVRVGCSSDRSSFTFVFPTERALLLGFANFFVEFDPDVVGGFEVASGDIPLLFRRAAALGSDVHRALSTLSRDSSHVAKLSRIQTYTAAWVRSKRRMTATSNQTTHYWDVRGRVFLDMQRVVQTGHALRTYTLQACVQEFLHRTEEFIDPAMLRALLLERIGAVTASADGGRHNAVAVTTSGDPGNTRDLSSGGSDEHQLDSCSVVQFGALGSGGAQAMLIPAGLLGRAERYAMRQAITPLLLMDRLMTLVQSVEIARTTGLNIRYVTIALTRCECSLQMLLNPSDVCMVMRCRDVWTRGQMIRSWSLLLRHARRLGYVLPAQRDNIAQPTMVSAPMLFDPLLLGTTGTVPM